MSQFAAALAAGLGSIRTLAGEPITYHAGDVVVEIALATRGQTTYESESESGVVITTRGVDFLVAVADLVDDQDAPIEPAAGHWLEAAGTVYEVLPVSDHKCYRFSDPGRTQYRIHTKQTAA